MLDYVTQLASILNRLCSNVACLHGGKRQPEKYFLKIVQADFPQQTKMYIALNVSL